MDNWWDIDFVVYGKPKTLKRHRNWSKNGISGTYDPSKDDKVDFLSIAHKNKPEKPYDQPLLVKYTFYFPRPKSHYKTGKLSHVLKPDAPKYYSNTPDSDNIEKFINDSLNSVFWKDDKLIASWIGDKLYDEIPRIHIQVKRIS
jgi:Holliday junction resolvase RusA-like endonuclease